MPLLLLRVALLLPVFLLPALSVSAAALSFSSLPDPLVVDTEFVLTVSISGCSSCGDSYLRGVFYPSGTNYFGLTQNQTGAWIGTSADKTQYFHVPAGNLVSGSWTGQINFKANSDSSDYSGPGTYSFKIGRYTSSSGSATWTDPVSVSLTNVLPTPTSTPAPTPNATPVLTPSPTSAPARFLLKIPKLPKPPGPPAVFQEFLRFLHRHT